MKKRNNHYPAFVCYDCAIAAGGKLLHENATYHEGNCGVCGKMRSITEPRDYGFPNFKTVIIKKVTPIKKTKPNKKTKGKTK